jgi:hypothetical protein
MRKLKWIRCFAPNISTGRIKVPLSRNKTIYAFSVVHSLIKINFDFLGITALFNF